MCMMLTQSIGFENFLQRRVAQIAQIMIPSDARLALVVDHVGPALDDRVFARIAHVVVPFDAPLALVVEYVATALRLTTHPKLHKNNQNWGVGSSCGTNKPPLANLSFPYEHSHIVMIS